jgi:NDP-sugar pyrophosphorylase family protein
MSHGLDVNLFFQRERLSHSEFFDVEDVFQLFGQSLKERLQKWLESFGVEQEPVVHGEVHPQAIIEGPVYVAEGARIGPTAYIQGPTFIGRDAEVRHAAFIRGNAFIGPSAVVGHTTEVKGAVFMDHAKAGHFAYVGDSLLGCDVNLGAGTKLANLKLDGREIRVRHPTDQSLQPSGLRKLGAIMGDESQTGCNAVLSPGTLLLPKTAVLPCVHFHGTLTKGFAR